MEISTLAKDIAESLRKAGRPSVAPPEILEEFVQEILDKAETMSGADFSDYDDDDEEEEGYNDGDEGDGGDDDDDEDEGVWPEDDDDLESDEDVRADLMDAIGDVNCDYLEHGHDR